MTELLAIALVLVSLGCLSCVVFVIRTLPPNNFQFLNDMASNILSAYERGQANAEENGAAAPWMSTPNAPTVTGPEGPQLPDEGEVIGKN